MLNEIASASPAFVFPYREETITALEWAHSKNNNWKFRYYLALNYDAIQRTEDAIRLLSYVVRTLIIPRSILHGQHFLPGQIRSRNSRILILQNVCHPMTGGQNQG